MQDITELERRITAAMERITRGVDALSGAAVQGGDKDEVARLSEALDEERMANAQLSERLRVLHEKAPVDAAAALREQLQAQAAELVTLRQVLAQAGDEIADLRAARAAEAAEAAEIAAALEPLIAEANHA